MPLGSNLCKAALKIFTQKSPTEPRFTPLGARLADDDGREGRATVESLWAALTMTDTD
jgi:hypothetical protein